MSTNYYLRAPECAGCAAPILPDLHLGKRSAGWAFLHAGNRGGNLECPRVEDRADWRQMIADYLALGWVIVDEAGAAQDEAAFAAMTAGWAGKTQGGEGMWVDEDGFWFCELAFC